MLLAMLSATMALGACARAGAEPAGRTPLFDEPQSEPRTEARQGRGKSSLFDDDCPQGAKGRTGSPGYAKIWRLGPSAESPDVTPLRRRPVAGAFPVATRYEARYEHTGPSPRFNMVVTFFSALAVLLIVVAWRRPSAPPPGVRPPPCRGLVCLTCSRCDRVIDVPADRLGRQLFCPRCGATLPSNA